MALKRIGEFEVEVSPPHPCWVSIKHDGVEMRFHHEHLRDLEYAVQTAIRQANDMLGPRESVDGKVTGAWR